MHWWSDKSIVRNNSWLAGHILCPPWPFITMQAIFGCTSDANEFITSNWVVINGCESFLWHLIQTLLMQLTILHTDDTPNACKCTRWHSETRSASSATSMTMWAWQHPSMRVIEMKTSVSLGIDSALSLYIFVDFRNNIRRQLQTVNHLKQQGLSEEKI